MDYDGTLAPITQTPDKAVTTIETREILLRLSKHPQCHLSIISGRKLSDLKHMVDIPNLTYVGNHGFEIEGQTNINFESLVSTQFEEDLAVLKEILTAKLSNLKGLWIEDKGIILTVHFRLATDKTGLLARKVFMKVCQNYLSNRRISFMEGKKVLEIRPPIKWDKGEAALWILSKWQRQLGKNQIVSMYIGDDFTDEDAFKILDGIAMTIKVGQAKQSFAHYYLKNQEEVPILLKQFDFSA
ncbi:MAG: trehalose-phosphatase [Candidatus Omnitrophica bacterium]|nr:trehalose-phosphatase [Candidatus Omnitrophota bacterium]